MISKHSALDYFISVTSIKVTIKSSPEEKVIDIHKNSP